MASPPHAAAQLVQLGQPVAFGVFDEHQCGIGYIDAHFDDRGRHQHVNAPLTESFHRRVRLGLVHASMELGQPQVGKHVAGQPLELRFHRPHRRLLPVRVDAGIDNAGLPAGLNLPSQVTVHLPAILRFPEQGPDGQPTGRSAPNFGDVGKAGQDPVERAWNRCGRHRYQMRCEALRRVMELVGDAFPLIHAESVFLVDHQQSQAVETHLRLHQGRRANHNAALAVGQPCTDFGLFRRGLGTRQQVHPDRIQGPVAPHAPDQRVKRVPVLARQQLRGRNHHGLKPQIRGQNHGRGDDRGLAAAGFAAQHAPGRNIVAQIIQNLSHRLLLFFRELKRQRSGILGHERRWRGNARGLPLEPRPAAGPDAVVQFVQFLERHPPTRPDPLLLVRRLVEHLERHPQGRQVVALPQVSRQGIVELLVQPRIQEPPDQLAHKTVGQARRQPVNGKAGVARHAPAGGKVKILAHGAAINRLHLGVVDEAPRAPLLHLAVNMVESPLIHRVEDPLIPPNQLDFPGTVRNPGPDARLAHMLAVTEPGLAAGHNAPHHGHGASGFQFTQLQVVEHLIPPGEIKQKIPQGVDFQLGQPFGHRRSHAAGGRHRVVQAGIGRNQVLPGMSIVHGRVQFVLLFLRVQVHPAWGRALAPAAQVPQEDRAQMLAVVIQSQQLRDRLDGIPGQAGGPSFVGPADPQLPHAPRGTAIGKSLSLLQIENRLQARPKRHIRRVWRVRSHKLASTTSTPTRLGPS